MSEKLSALSVSTRRSAERASPPAVVKSPLGPKAEAEVQAALAKSIAHTATGGRLYDQEEAEAFVRERRKTR